MKNELVFTDDELYLIERTFDQAYSELEREWFDKMYKHIDMLDKGFEDIDLKLLELTNNLYASAEQHRTISKKIEEWRKKNGLQEDNDNTNK